jgi:hypothetical protein
MMFLQGETRKGVWGDWSVENCNDIEFDESQGEWKP